MDRFLWGSFVVIWLKLMQHWRLKYYWKTKICYQSNCQVYPQIQIVVVVLFFRKDPKPIGVPTKPPFYFPGQANEDRRLSE